MISTYKMDELKRKFEELIEAAYEEGYDDANEDCAEDMAYQQGLDDCDCEEND